jgi:TonB family protein
MITAFALALSLFAADGDQDALNAARDLYASAAYEDALAVLNRVSETSRPADEARAVSQYRAFCLLALGRTAEAERAIETMITRDPTYQPPTSDMSPRVRSAFVEVRRRIMPGIIQQTYAQAKSAYDRKEYEIAAAGFGHVLQVMSDPELAALFGQPPLSDLRTLAGGFRDLSVSAATPPPLPVVPPAAPVAAAVAPAVVQPPRIYSSNDTGVVAPQVIRQELPGFSGPMLMAKQGAIEVTIDETGAVVMARMRQSVAPQYDAQAVKAAQGWKYTPATVDGKPVKYRKLVQVTIKPKS